MTRIKEILKADARYKEAMAKLEKIKNIDDDEEREKAIQGASRLIVEAAYDRAETYEIVAFTLIQSADKLLRNSADIMGAVKENVKYQDKFKLGEAMKSLNKIISHFDHESQKIHKEYHLHGYVEDSDLVPFDAIDQNKDLMLNFNLRLYNALFKSKGNANLLLKYLKRLKGEGEVFSEEEINSL